MATLEEATDELAGLQGRYQTDRRQYDRTLVEAIHSGDERPEPPNQEEYEHRRAELREVIERITQELRTWAISFQRLVQEHAEQAANEAQLLIWKAEADIPDLERALANARVEVRRRELALHWIETTAAHNGLMAGWEFERASQEAEKSGAPEPTVTQLSRAMTGGHDPDVDDSDERSASSKPAELTDEEIAAQVHSFPPA
jgi:hypothetical protein